MDGCKRSLRLEEPRPALSSRQVKALDHGQEQEASSDEVGDGVVPLTYHEWPVNVFEPVLGTDLW
jgi:hypothetical protein